MKKVGIITINDYNNYGNRLQCYAVQKVLNENNVYCENIINIRGSKKKKYEKLKNIVKGLFNYKGQCGKNKRNKLFCKFNKNIVFSKYKIIDGKIDRNINKEYDFFIVGSDQVWNPEFAAYDEDFLTFAENNKKIAFSASFGVNDIKNELRESFSNELRKFKSISVRENRGKEIIRDLTGREDVQVLIDPTMLLTKDEWKSVMKKPKNLKFNRYILMYFLGEIQEDWINEIKRIAEENDCYIINVLDNKDKFYRTGPKEFLYLEKNAFLICTDSFHSSVFGIIFDTPFIVFERKDTWGAMNSRLDTLLLKFNLENRKFNNHIENELLKCNYATAKEILKNEKKHSIEFIQKALEIEE